MIECHYAAEFRGDHVRPNAAGVPAVPGQRTPEGYRAGFSGCVAGPWMTSPSRVNIEP
jgi:hypothetical protein